MRLTNWLEVRINRISISHYKIKLAIDHLLWQCNPRRVWSIGAEAGIVREGMVQVVENLGHLRLNPHCTRVCRSSSYSPLCLLRLEIVRLSNTVLTPRFFLHSAGRCIRSEPCRLNISGTTTEVKPGGRWGSPHFIGVGQPANYFQTKRGVPQAGSRGDGVTNADFFSGESIAAGYLSLSEKTAKAACQSLGVLGLTFPNYQGPPPQLPKLSKICSIPHPVAGQLRPPKLNVGLRNTPPPTPLVLVPKTAVYKHSLLPPREYEIRSARQPSSMEPKSVPQGKRRSTNTHFGGCVTAADGTHIGAPSFRRELIRHTRTSFEANPIPRVARPVLHASPGKEARLWSAFLR